MTAPDHKRTALTPYEQEQLGAITQWKSQEPSVLSKAFRRAGLKLQRLVQIVLPEFAIRAVLDMSSTAAQWMTDTDDLLKEARVERIEELRNRDLELSDRLADGVHRWAIGIASAEGAAAGAAGLVGVAADIPGIIVIALRTVYKIGACYGFDVRTKQDRDFVLAIMAAAGANEMEEKELALAALGSIEAVIAKQAFSRLSQKATVDQMSKHAATVSVQRLAHQLGLNLTRRKALQAIPVVGALVGASVNGWYIREVGWAARRAFQERWLLDSGKVALLPDRAKAQ